MIQNASAFQNRSVWIFDIDYTLYGPSAALFEQVVPRITQCVAHHLDLPLAEARKVQRDYYLAYGSTMAGMARHHGVDPHEFAGFVHDIDYGVLTPNPKLRELIAALPGQKLIFTNATLSHANHVLNGLGLSFDDFDGSFDVEMADWTPKPDRLPYERIAKRFGFENNEAVFFEDTAKNLETARDLGWGTVWVNAADDARQDGIVFDADAQGPDAESLIEAILKSV